MSNVRNWLILSSFMVVLMVFWGGLTRLTHSGLSITDWRPISGILPPLSEKDWEHEKEKYHLTPEYNYINYGIELSEFKFIYLVEYFHRFLARMTFIVVALPLIFFRNHLVKIEFILMILVVLMICMQGFFGWYMVKSGLSDVPYVSHYKLALHLMTALCILSLLLEVLSRFLVRVKNYSVEHKGCLSLSLLCLLTIQIFYGTLTAGLGAGLIYNNFPMMGANFFPEFANPLSDPATVQFVHRVFGFMTLILSIIEISYKRSAYSFILILLVVIQFIVGVIMLIFSIPLYTSLFHQVNAFSIFALVFFFFRVNSLRKNH